MLQGKFCKNLAGFKTMKLEETALKKSVDEKRAREMTGSERLSCHLLNWMQDCSFSTYASGTAGIYLPSRKKLLGRYVGKDDNLPVTQSPAEEFRMGNGQYQGQNFCKMVV